MLTICEKYSPTQPNQSINQIKIYLATLEALQGDSKVAWANPKLPPKKIKNNTIK